jgi:NAD(P)-dependent dehydrogenase (short-subunit alcohol dehydrogenase family)
VTVTGGSRGIGYGIADAGAHVTIVGVMTADLARPSECARMAEEVMSARGVGADAPVGGKGL